MEPTSVNMGSIEAMFRRMQEQEEHMQEQKRLMTQFMEQKEREDANIKETLAKIQEQRAEEKARQEAINKLHNERLEAIEERSAEIWQKAKIEGGAAVGKVVLKVGSRHFVFHVAKILSVESAREAAKMAAKVVPFVGLIIGAAAFAYRYKSGEPLKAVGEVASGLVGLIPLGAVLAPSLTGLIPFAAILAPSIDAIMGLHDMYECSNAFEANQVSNVTVEQEMTLQTAYKTLLIESENPTQEEVDHAYRLLTGDSSSDPIQNENKIKDLSTIKNCDNLMVMLSASRKLIYKQRGWQLNNSEEKKNL
ncbi:MAG: hypothetical protein ACXWM7_00080 [Parachlamydiaceae bacterium]